MRSHALPALLLFLLFDAFYRTVLRSYVRAYIGDQP